MKTYKNVRLFMKLSVEYYRICFTKTQLLKLAQPMLKNGYGQYLKELAASR